jgi:phosphatidylserine/phosphatidylglycerophosphate/cardiolipin synthase-like enzyme
MFNFWSQKWIEAHDNCLVYYHDRNQNPRTLEGQQDQFDLDGILRIDSGLSISSVGRYLIIQTNSRKLTLHAPSLRHACEWRDSLLEFYAAHVRTRPLPFRSSFPPRQRVEELQVFTCSRDYFYHVTRCLLLAKEEILISAWKLSPKVLLTRPPLPPLRLDQVLRYKADQGVKIFILLYQEVLSSPSFTPLSYHC